MKTHGRTALVMLILLATGCSESGSQTAAPAPDPAPMQSALPRAALPLGEGSLEETWQQCVVAPGIILTRILRGDRDRQPNALPCEGIEQFSLSGGGSGRLTPGSDGTASANGPYAVHVLEVDGSLFPGTMEWVLGEGAIPGKASPEQVARQRGAVAAVNAGFFVIGAGSDGVNADGMAGDPAGIGVMDGTLVSETIAGRTAIAWQDGDAGTVSFPQLSQQSTLVVDGGALSFRVDGVNRIPGAIRNCGGLGDDPTDEPRHDQTCTDDGEIVAFLPVWGRNTPTGEGWELVINGSGRLVEQRERGGPIPAAGMVVVATGDQVAPLSAVEVGADVVLEHVLTNSARESAEAFVLEPGLSVTNGGPVFVRARARVNRDAEEGFVEPFGGDPGENPIKVIQQTMALNRFRDDGQPRTLAGVTTQGRLLLIVVDGRQPDWSVGLTFEDARDLLLHFDVDTGMNLDGGGSSSMAIHGTTVNSPSDGAARAVSDVIVFVPGE